MAEFFNANAPSLKSMGNSNSSKKRYKIIKLDTSGCMNLPPMSNIGDVVEGEKKKVTIHGCWASKFISGGRTGRVLAENVDAIVTGEYVFSDENGRQFIDPIAYPVSWLRETDEAVSFNSTQSDSDMVDDTINDESINDKPQKSVMKYLIIGGAFIGGLILIKSLLGKK